MVAIEILGHLKRKGTDVIVQNMFGRRKCGLLLTSMAFFSHIIFAQQYQFVETDVVADLNQLTTFEECGSRCYALFEDGNANTHVGYFNNGSVVLLTDPYGTSLDSRTFQVVSCGGTCYFLLQDAVIDKKFLIAQEVNGALVALAQPYGAESYTIDSKIKIVSCGNSCFVVAQGSSDSQLWEITPGGLVNVSLPSLLDPIITGLQSCGSACYGFTSFDLFRINDDFTTTSINLMGEYDSFKPSQLFSCGDTCYVIGNNFATPTDQVIGVIQYDDTIKPIMEVGGELKTFFCGNRCFVFGTGTPIQRGPSAAPPFLVVLSETGFADVTLPYGVDNENYSIGSMFSACGTCFVVFKNTTKTAPDFVYRIIDETNNLVLADFSADFVSALADSKNTVLTNQCGDCCYIAIVPGSGGAHEGRATSATSTKKTLLACMNLTDHTVTEIMDGYPTFLDGSGIDNVRFITCGGRCFLILTPARDLTPVPSDFPWIVELNGTSQPTVLDFVAQAQAEQEYAYPSRSVLNFADMATCAGSCCAVLSFHVPIIKSLSSQISSDLALSCWCLQPVQPAVDNSCFCNVMSALCCNRNSLSTAAQLYVQASALQRQCLCNPKIIPAPCAATILIAALKKTYGPVLPDCGCEDRLVAIVAQAITLAESDDDILRLMNEVAGISDCCMLPQVLVALAKSCATSGDLCHFITLALDVYNPNCNLVCEFFAMLVKEGCIGLDGAGTILAGLLSTATYCAVGDVVLSDLCCACTDGYAGIDFSHLIADAFTKLNTIFKSPLPNLTCL